MEYVADFKFSEKQANILDSVMPGGEKWEAFKETGGRMS